MKVNSFKKLIRDIIREELDYKFTVLEKKLDEVLVSNRSDVIVEDTESQLDSSPTKKVPVPAAKANGQAAPLTKDSILNDILNETAQEGEWKNINKEAETKSVTDNTQGLPEHLTEAFTKDYSSMMKAADEKAKFRSGS